MVRRVLKIVSNRESRMLARVTTHRAGDANGKRRRDVNIPSRTAVRRIDLLPSGLGRRSRSIIHLGARSKTLRGNRRAFYSTFRRKPLVKGSDWRRQVAGPCSAGEKGNGNSEPAARGRPQPESAPDLGLTEQSMARKPLTPPGPAALTLLTMDRRYLSLDIFSWTP